MGASSSKIKERRDDQNINVIITIKTNNEPNPNISHNDTTKAVSNINENIDPFNDAPPPSSFNPPINTYDNGRIRLSIKDGNGNIISKNNQNENYEIIIDNNKIRNNNNLNENTHKGGNIDINKGGDQEKYPQKQTSTGGNININYGGNIYGTKKKETSNDLRTVENIDVNIGENNSSNKGETTNFFNKPRNIDVNIGGNKSYNEGESTNTFNTRNIDVNIGGNKSYNEGESTNTFNPRNIDVNIGGNKSYNEGESTNTFNPRNIDVNIGGNKSYNEGESINTFNPRNIDVNIGGNKKYEDVKNTNGFTEKGNIDINSGGNKKQEEFTKNPYKKTDNIDINENGINQQNNYVCNDLSMSYNVLTLSALNINPLSPEFKFEIAKKINEGYFPLFIKIDKLKPVFFFVKNESTLKPAFYEYLKRFEMENDIDKYTLYNQDEAIDLDIPVKYLNIKQMGVISNKKNE